MNEQLRKVERVRTRKERWEVEKDLSRLAAAWRDRVAAAINELTRQAERHALREMGALEMMARETDSDVPQLHEGIADSESLAAGPMCADATPAARVPC